MKNINKPIFYMSVGIPGCGKSTWAETHKDELNAVVHSSDFIREELGDVNDQSKNEEVFKILHQRIKDDLRAGKNVVYDATSLARKRRMYFINTELKDILCEKVCVLFACPFELALSRNFARDRQVPEEVMSRMYKNFETPWYNEGWDDIQIVWADYNDMLGFEYDIHRDMEEWEKISHSNPHHSYSIGDHMLSAYDYMRDTTEDEKLITLALLHDCGKPDVRAFVNSKGEETDVAHYYQHHSVGSYKALFYLRNMYPEWTDKDILYISLLINLHMRPHIAWKQSDKAKERDRKLYGDDVIRDLELLHEVDCMAH